MIFFIPVTISECGTRKNPTFFACLVTSSDRSRYFTVGKFPVNLKLYITGKSFPITGKYRKFYKPTN